MAEHTPGPWAIFDRPREPVVYGRPRAIFVHAGPDERDDTGFNVVARCLLTQGYDPDAERDANARLIAAAPDLLAAAEAWESADDARNNCECENEGQWEHCEACSERFGDAIVLRRAAIAKARGSHEG